MDSCWFPFRISDKSDTSDDLDVVPLELEEESDDKKFEPSCDDSSSSSNGEQIINFSIPVPEYSTGYETSSVFPFLTMLLWRTFLN